MRPKFANAGEDRQREDFRRSKQQNARSMVLVGKSVMLTVAAPAFNELQKRTLCSVVIVHGFTAEAN